MNTHDRMAEEIDDLQRANALKGDVIAELQSERQSIKARLAALEAKQSDKPAEPAKPKTLDDVIEAAIASYRGCTIIGMCKHVTAAVLRHEAADLRAIAIDIRGKTIPDAVALERLADRCEQEARSC